MSQGHTDKNRKSKAIWGQDWESSELKRTWQILRSPKLVITSKDNTETCKSKQYIGVSSQDFLKA